MEILKAILMCGVLIAAMVIFEMHTGGSYMGTAPFNEGAAIFLLK